MTDQALQHRPLHQSVTNRLLDIAAALLTRVGDVVLWLPRFWRLRAELSMLASMGEVERRDIGVTAMDVENAFAAPLSSNPLSRLARSVEARRHGGEL